MGKRQFLGILCVGVVLAAVSGSASGNVIWHDPYLNWDFINQTGVMVNDLDIIVDNPNFSPNLNDPSQVWSVPFPTVALTNLDYDGDGDQDTRVRYSGANVNAGTNAHGGLYMSGSGLVLDAYWTLNGAKVGPSTPVTYERTRVVGDPAIYMELSMGQGFFTDPANSGREAGWTNIRTFVNLPATLLNLPDIGSSLNLSTLSQYEVFPRLGGPTGNVIQPSDIIYAPIGDPLAFADIYLSNIDPEFSNSNYEALLVATVVATGSPPIPTGAFWNLNPQSPEPATLLLLALGGLAAVRRRR